jgi:hypothetical protein
LKAWLIIAQGILGISCVSLQPPKSALRGQPISAANGESPKIAEVPQNDKVNAQDAHSEKRPRLLLPPAEASFSSVRASIVPFLSKQDQPALIASILGYRGKVWLLAFSSLYESDGKRIRLASQAICGPAESILSPCFDSINLKGHTLELLGTRSGGCGAASASAARKSDGSWRCESELRESFGIRRFRSSSGELVTVKHTSDGSDFDFGAMLNGELSHRVAPIAVAKGGVHAWALVEENGTHLVEWTGMRWRERTDALPEGISADDILAMTVDDEGNYYAAAGSFLLVFDGTHFVAHAVPRGFFPELLVATKARGLWALGGGRAWHYEPPAWRYVALPMAHVNSEWLAPDGTLWIAGSSDATEGERESNSAEANSAVVVTLSLSEMKEGRSP